MGGGVPNTLIGFQYPHSFNSYVGFSIHNQAPLIDKREYVSGTLSDSLIAGHRYCVSFYVSAPNNCKYLTDDIGAYFCADTSAITDYTTNLVLNLVPQIENTQGNILNDTLNWMLVSGMFLAQGGEKFITIGNFKNDANTTIDTLQGATQPVGYYYLDDVSVTDCTVGIEEINSNGEKISVAPSPAQEKITVQSTGKIRSIEIINTLGESILKRNYAAAKNKTEINVASLPTGLYFLKCTNDKKVIIEKFVKE